MNINVIEKHVSTDYNDYIGVIKISGHLNSSLDELCKEYGFSIEGISIVGFGLEESTTNGVGKEDEVACTILYVQDSEYGDSFETIKVKSNSDGILIVKKKIIYINYSEIGKYIKAFHFLAITEMGRNIQEIKIDQSLDKE
jgi:hypothetical protein